MEREPRLESDQNHWDRETLIGVSGLVAGMAFDFSPEAARIEEVESELVRAHRDGLKEGYSQALGDIQELLRPIISKLP